MGKLNVQSKGINKQTILTFQREIKMNNKFKRNRKKH